MPETVNYLTKGLVYSLSDGIRQRGGMTTAVLVGQCLRSLVVVSVHPIHHCLRIAVLRLTSTIEGHFYIGTPTSR
jgi:hypothetical protein